MAQISKQTRVRFVIRNQSDNNWLIEGNDSGAALVSDFRLYLVRKAAAQ